MVPQNPKNEILSGLVEIMQDRSELIEDQERRAEGYVKVFQRRQLFIVGLYLSTAFIHIMASAVWTSLAR